jgi:hypothetical protein
LPSSLGLALVYLSVQRALRSFCRDSAGLLAQSAGMRPSLIARVSAALLRCFGAATIEASMI